jgi:hypothetical protein
MGTRRSRVSGSVGPEPENAAAERRKARRARVMGPAISGDPEMGPIARRTIGCGGFRTSACRRSAPLTFFGERKTDKGHPPPSNRAGGALAV